jgi:hypothetical protein
MTIDEIYRKYRILPGLQDHQLRVSAVAQYLCDQTNVFVKIETDNAVKACAIHDMGNILKFNFELMPERYEPEGLTYWLSIRDEYQKMYGQDEHTATVAIARELGMSDRVINLIDGISFSNAITVCNSDDFTQKICTYADKRVAPTGVVSLAERLEEGRKRYAVNKPDVAAKYNAGDYENLVKHIEKIEEDIFLQMGIVPESINEEAIAPYIYVLKLTELN